MPITANTHPETTVDKNGKQTTVHRASKKSAAGKSSRSLPAPSAVPAEQTEPIEIPQYAVNPKGYPVTYVIMYEYSDQYSNESHFAGVATTLEEAQAFDHGYHKVYEYNLVTQESIPLHVLKSRQELKEQLIALYASGAKREVFENLDVYLPFEEQTNIDLHAEWLKTREVIKRREEDARLQRQADINEKRRQTIAAKKASEQ